ncbi:hypothetical protein [Mycobacteroides chelonae]|uniref:hypothetical protein n=1 Tax=Mycobacteroides chelonae TaxID=1774 RepID=UPI0004AAADA1|nr:hypothetical protein [Mycobacteroides chelonae]OHT67776.1 hypothetical protein BKG66_24420 [Mycobacteroides chelonae]OHT69419.1 hypothetical protein BKG67_22955 [Mycobacteroides chelonae]
MKYTVGTVSKAALAGIVAFFGAIAAAAQGADLATLDIGSWLTALGTGVVATGGVLTTPKKAGDDEEPSPVDQIVNNIPIVAAAVSKAQADLERVKQATADSLGDVPVFGPLAKQAFEQIVPKT